MDNIKKAMLAMKNEKDAENDRADQLEEKVTQANEEKLKVSLTDCNVTHT